MVKTILSNEDGHSLLELSLSLPVMILLALTLGTLFLWTTKLFVYELADWTLQSELFSVMNRIVRDARAAEKVQISKMTYSSDPEEYDGIMFWKPRCYPSSEKNIAYYFAYQPIHTQSSTWKIYRRRDYTPITGDNIFCKTYILKFHCIYIPPARVRIELIGASRITSHIMEIHTELFLSEMMKHALVLP